MKEPTEVMWFIQWKPPAGRNHGFIEISTLLNYGYAEPHGNVPLTTTYISHYYYNDYLYNATDWEIILAQHGGIPSIIHCKMIFTIQVFLW